MLRALGCGLEHMVALSRSCRCHKRHCVTPTLTSTMVFITYRGKMYKKSAKVICCGKGLVACKLATGGGMRAVDESYQQLRLYLMIDFRLLFPKDLDSILSDWERGSHHIRYETQIKLSVYQQFPFFALCHCGGGRFTQGS